MKGYRELSSNSPEEITLLNANDNPDDFPKATRKRRLRDPLIIVAVVQALVLLLGGISLVQTRINKSSCKQSPPSNNNLLYSPAQVLINTEQVKVFDDGRFKRTIYQGAGPEVDKAWEDLYNIGTVIKLSREEAEQLPNKTYPVEGAPGYYLGALDVFHQLHCLNKVRQIAHGSMPLEHSDPDGANHLDHCVEILRKSIICRSDTSVLVWQWDEKEQRVMPQFDYPHTCRSFEDLRDWALSRKIGKKIDMYRFIADDLPTPPIIYG